MTANPLTPEEERGAMLLLPPGVGVRMKATLDAARADAAGWREEWRRARTLADSYLANCDELGAELDAARARCAEVENVNLGLLRNIAALTAERDTLREQVRVLRESLGRCLQSAMKYGREGQVEMIQEALSATEEKPVAEVGYGCTGCRSTPCICDKLTEDKP